MRTKIAGISGGAEAGEILVITHAMVTSRPPGGGDWLASPRLRLRYLKYGTVAIVVVVLSSVYQTEPRSW